MIKLLLQALPECRSRPPEGLLLFGSDLIVSFKFPVDSYGDCIFQFKKTQFNIMQITLKKLLFNTIICEIRFLILSPIS